MEFYRPSDHEFVKVDENRSNKIIHGEKMTLGMWKMAKGVEFALHSHEHEQVALIAQGAVEFRTQDKKVVVREGELIAFKGFEEHGGLALEDTVIYDFFAPAREDFKEMFKYLEPK